MISLKHYVSLGVKKLLFRKWFTAFVKAPIERFLPIRTVPKSYAKNISAFAAQWFEQVTTLLGHATESRSFRYSILPMLLSLPTRVVGLGLPALTDRSPEMAFATDCNEKQYNGHTVLTSSPLLCYVLRAVDLWALFDRSCANACAAHPVAAVTANSMIAVIGAGLLYMLCGASPRKDGLFIASIVAGSVVGICFGMRALNILMEVLPVAALCAKMFNALYEIGCYRCD